jgi:hypothetical protein
MSQFVRLLVDGWKFGISFTTGLQNFFLVITSGLALRLSSVFCP